MGVTHSLLPELFINYGSVLFFLLGLFGVLKSASKLSKYKVEFSILMVVPILSVRSQYDWTGTRLLPIPFSALDFFGSCIRG